MPIAIAVTPPETSSTTLSLKPIPNVNGPSSYLDARPTAPTAPTTPTTPPVAVPTTLPVAAPTTLPVAGWQLIAEKKRLQRDQAIPAAWCLPPGLVPDDRLSVIGVPEECGLLSPRELEITGTDAEVLLSKLVEREYSSYEVTLAFCKRAAIAQQLTNCLSEIFFSDALIVAAQLDADYAQSGVPVGPLHGLPISLKDCFQIQGVDATIGYTTHAFDPATKEDESEITRIMRECGAVLFCKTSVPLAMMSGETYNNIYGYTTNPHNRNLSSGGSSGGESALLAMKGSPLGVGTDVGGSVRIPASWCGLYSLKPSSGRIPTSGLKDPLPGQEAVKNTVGPLCSSLGGVEAWCRAVVGCEPWREGDPGCLPIPWREVEVPEKLCFGLVLDDGMCKPLPPVTRALLETKRALEAAGHTVVELDLHDPFYAESLKFALYRSAAARLICDTLSTNSEPWPAGFDMFQAMTDPSLPSCFCLSSSGSGALTPSIGAQSLVETTRPLSVPATVSELWVAQSKRTEYSKRMMCWWAGTKGVTNTGREIDALILPCTVWPAAPKYGCIYDNYTSLWNVLDYCGTTVPVTSVSAVVDDKPADTPRNEVEARVWDGYSPEESIGCPVAIQLVGRRLNEEYLLGVTRVCDDALKAASVSAPS